MPSPTPPHDSLSRSPSPSDPSPGVAEAFGPRSYWVGGDARLALVRKNATRLLEEWLLTKKPFPMAEALDQVAEPFRTCCLAVLILGQRIATAFEQACTELGEDRSYDDALAANYRVVSAPLILPLSLCVLTCAIAQEWYAQCA
jgi:hypothetical protein